jgi:hypothetical protein
MGQIHPVAPCGKGGGEAGVEPGCSLRASGTTLRSCRLGMFRVAFTRRRRPVGPAPCLQSGGLRAKLRSRPRSRQASVPAHAPTTLILVVFTSHPAVCLSWTHAAGNPTVSVGVRGGCRLSTPRRSGAVDHAPTCWSGTLTAAGRRTVTLSFVFLTRQAWSNRQPTPTSPPSIRQHGNQPPPPSSPCSALQTRPQPHARGNHGVPPVKSSPRGSTNYREILCNPLAAPLRHRSPANRCWPLVDRTQRHLVVRERSFPGRWALGKAVHHPGVVDRLCSRYWTREGGWVKMAPPPVLPRNALSSLPIFHPTPSTLRHWGQQTSRDLRLSS